MAKFTKKPVTVEAITFNAEIGRRIARENAERDIWPLLGFRLRDKMAAD